MIRLKGSINYINILLKNRKGRVGEPLLPTPSPKKGQKKNVLIDFLSPKLEIYLVVAEQ